MKRLAAWTLPLLAAAQAHAQELPASPAVEQSSAISEQEVLLFEVTLDGGTLTEALQVYEMGGGLALPVGELARLLDLNIEVRPRDRQIVGTIGSGQRPLLVDIASGTARIDTRNVSLKPGDAVAGLTDIYLSVKLIEQLLPLRVAVDNEGLVIALSATEQLPIQARLERLGRLRELSPDVDSREEVYFIGSAPALWSMPAFDVAADASLEATAPQFRRRYDVRFGADALYTNLQGYVGSDAKGRPITSRFLFERRDLDGDLLGPVGATRFSFGDVYTPSLAIGARSIGGRGVTLSTAPLQQTSVFDRVDLRGELPIGFDVELYINDVLRGGQQTPVQGRYEFLDVPLVRGLNVIRIVSYGPRGERFEDTRVVNVAGGALPKGEATFEFGVVEQETPLIDLRRKDGVAPAPGVGELRVSAGVAYGLTEKMTVIGGAALFTPGLAGERKLGTLGLRTSLLGYAVQLDGAYDDAGGHGLSIGAAGTPLGVSTIVRHAEYRNGFVDESLAAGTGGAATIRHTELTADFSVGPVIGYTFPFSLRAQRDEFADGRTALVGGLRLSTTTSKLLLSGGLDYALTTTPGLGSVDRLTGTVAASTFSQATWDLRATLDYEVLPSTRLRAFTATADRDLSERLAIRFGAGRAFVGDNDMTFQAATIVRLPFADLSLSGEYTTPRDDWRIGLQLAFGLVFDPGHRRYALARPGAATGGSAAIQAFIDRDADDRFDPGADEPVANIVASTGAGEVSTGSDGQALVTGLGYGATARLQVNLDGLDNPYVTAPPQVIEFVPRAGVVATVPYPLKPVGEVLARVQYRDANGRMTGVSAVDVRLTDAAGKTTNAATEFDGTVLFERLAAGRYRLELDPRQAERLGMRLSGPIEFTGAPDGGFVPDIVATVEFEKR